MPKKSSTIPILLALFIFLSPTPTKAQETNEDFSTAYSVSYDFSKAPVTSVDFLISVTNLTNQTYISEYTLNFDLKVPKNIKAYDQNGQLQTQIEDNDTGTRVKTLFDDKIVGKGSVRSWHLVYTDNKIGRKIGLVWNISIPKFTNLTSLDSYNVKLVIPETFGPEIYSSPEATRIEKDDPWTIYYFENDDLKDHGALLNFGSFQLYSFSLKYHLKNPNLFASTVSLALPPNIRGEQEMYLRKIDPEPIDIQIDVDGNYLANYKLIDNKEITVLAEGYVRVAHPQRNFSQSGNFTEIPQEFKDNYLKRQPYWEVDDPQIKKIVEKSLKPNQSVSELARSLFDYVVTHLQYNRNRINNDLVRYGAKKALQNTNDAVCMEFADLLTTLLRSAGIPAQVLDGFALTEDGQSRPVIGDVLHSWVRYYDPRIGWVSVDPTWAATSQLDFFSRLDTNHLVFAIKGSSSTQPFPAGAYKISPSQTGDLKVFPIEADIDFPKESIKITNKIDQMNFLQPEIVLVIKNTGQIAIFDSVLNLSSSKNQILAPQEIKIGDLPPYGQSSIKLKPKLGPLSQSLDLPLELDLSFTNFAGEFQSLNWKESLNFPSNLLPSLFSLGIFSAIVLWVFRILKDRLLVQKK